MVVGVAAFFTKQQSRQNTNAAGENFSGGMRQTNDTRYAVVVEAQATAESGYAQTYVVKLYTGGDGIDIANDNTVSLVIDNTSVGGLTVGGDEELPLHNG